MDIYEPLGNHKPRKIKSTQKIKIKEPKQNTKENKEIKRNKISKEKNR